MKIKHKFKIMLKYGEVKRDGVKKLSQRQNNQMFSEHYESYI